MVFIGQCHCDTLAVYGEGIFEFPRLISNQQVEQPGPSLKMRHSYGGRSGRSRNYLTRRVYFLKSLGFAVHSTQPTIFISARSTGSVNFLKF